MVNTSFSPAVESDLMKKGLMMCHRLPRKNIAHSIFYGHNPLKHSQPLFYAQASFIIIITQLLRLLLRPLRQPRIISEILGGLIVGPTVLSRSKTFRTQFLLEKVQFLGKNVGLIGFVYFFFLSGVKTDLGAVRKVGSKHWYLAAFTVFVPFVCDIFIGIAFRKSMEKELAKASSIFEFSAMFALTAFPVIYPIIKEFNLLSSEIGRMALSVAVISDVIGAQFLIAFDASKQMEAKTSAGVWFIVSTIVIMASIFLGIRHVMVWIVRLTPEGKPVEQIYVVAILLGVLVFAFISDFCGLSMVHGPLWFGLAVPDGPPLGATIVEKCETIVIELLMPFSYAFIGSVTDISAMSGQWTILRPMFIMALVGYTTKLLSVLLSSRFLNLPLRDGLALSLILSLRGQVEVLLYMRWMNVKLITPPFYSMLVVMTLVVTATATPLLSLLYDPTRPYRVHNRRSVQHTAPNADLSIVACIYEEGDVPGLIKLIELSNPTVNSPFSVHAIHLVDLVARAVPVFINHQVDQTHQSDQSNPIHNALKLFQDSRSSENIKINSYTTISPKRSLYRDVCELALMMKASLIIFPFHGCTGGGVVESEGGQSVAASVLSHAPCSVAIFVDRGFAGSHNINSPTRRSMHHFAFLFLGGADSREALVCADRMAAKPDVWLTVIRFLSHDGEGDNEMEKELDDGLVTWFWMKNEANRQVVYRESVVKNGEETLAAIQSMKDDYFDLWILGRKHGINPVILQGLTDCSKNHELGVIGDYMANSDLGITSSILVMQQQILRDRESACSAFIGRLQWCL
ncbi:PREDICTED: cation/H(+) antiporter 24-like [Ipomoea nil]|uniref:cation/H(+) antiporter 24-like n=1 Tax=Ipomoea nil TaxID=35883 RepID=UPI000900D41A|nr:PREDICTED: cation/H(+) antiporter 24-like [Ipomoea nil]